VELGQVFGRFGSSVTIVEVGPRLLPLEEPESGRLLSEALEADGLRIVCGAEVRSARSSGHAIVSNLRPASRWRAIISL